LRILFFGWIIHLEIPSLGVYGFIFVRVNPNGIIPILLGLIWIGSGIQVKGYGI